MATPEKIVKFYHSKKWKDARALKVQLARGLCEECGRRGYEVHHKIPLSLSNIDNPSIALAMENLQLLCTSCHDAKRGAAEKELRNDLEFDSEGNLVLKTSPPGSKN